MQSHRRITDQTSKTIALLVAAATICSWTIVMGALAAKGIDHVMLDGITCVAVATLGCAGIISATVRKRSRHASLCPESKEPQGLNVNAGPVAHAVNVTSSTESTLKEPALSPTERVCLALAQAHDLSLREREVLSLMATGITGKEIAVELTLSYNTVKSHIRHIYSKLDVHRKQDLVDLIERQKEHSV